LRRSFFDLEAPKSEHQTAGLELSEPTRQDGPALQSPEVIVTLSGDGEAMRSFIPNSSVWVTAMSSRDSSPLWFAAYTHSCQEKRVAQHLSTRNIEFFLPVHRTISHWKNGLRVPIERPLFAGYIFVKISREFKVRILEVPGVHSIVGAGREPIPLPYDEMEALRRGVGLLNVEPHPFVRAGERALIRRGPLEGMTGIVMRQKNKNNVRVILSIDLIMKSISVEVAAEDLEIAGQDCSTYEYVLP
jgi:transcription antitermination factor NusG